MNSNGGGDFLLIMKWIFQMNYITIEYFVLNISKQSCNSWINVIVVSFTFLIAAQYFARQEKLPFLSPGDNYP